MDYKFEFIYDDKSYYSLPMNEFRNSFYYYSKHKNSEYYIPIKKDEFYTLKMESQMDYEFQFKYGKYSYYTRTTNLTKYYLKTLNNERIFQVVTEEYFNKQQLKALKKEVK